MRRAKIIATLGPSTADYDTVRALVAAGMDVARINRTHGDDTEHELAYAHVRRAAQECGRAVAVMVDLQGMKMRLGELPGGELVLEAGQTLTITTAATTASATRVQTTYPNFAQDARPGGAVVVQDGHVHLRILAVEGDDVHTEVIRGGRIATGQDLHLPGAHLSAPPLTEKDESDLRWALALGADLIAQPFVRSPRDSYRARVVMAEEGRHVPLLAKIERPEAVDHLQDIVDAFDGILLARGDLGVELAVEEVPIVQKQAIEAARRWAKPVIVATQMLESMIVNPVPTRAETSDVANAVLDGADAVMLSGETSVGAHPLAAVDTAVRIVTATEEQGLDRIPALGTAPRTQGGIMTLAARSIADFVGARYHCVFSQSGDSVRRIARLRGDVPILAFTDLASTRSQLALVWGATPFLVPRAHTTDDLMELLDDTLLATGLAQPGDRVVVTAGSPPGHAGSTNNVRVHTVGAGVGE